LIAERGPDAIYTGEVARSICSVCWLEEDDLAGYRPRWVEPLRLSYRGVEVLELPPPTQGVAALEALGLLEGMQPTLQNRVAAAGLALEDARAHVRDGADVRRLLEPETWSGDGRTLPVGLRPSEEARCTFASSTTTA
jgi:gamma-glutamyltranspeptidase/glutathione hydrolase